MVVALIPAHNESAGIGATIASVAPQVDLVVVVCDNCTDDTQAIAETAGAETFVTVGNTAKKAGALNQALTWLLRFWQGDILVVDADSIIAEDFVRSADRQLRNPAVGAVGGIFYGARPTSVLERFQVNEYARYAREIEHHGKVRVLTGTASLFRHDAVIDMIDYRQTEQGPEGGGQSVQAGLYDPDALTED